MALPVARWWFQCAGRMWWGLRNRPGDFSRKLVTNGDKWLKTFFFFEPITWGKGRNCTKNFVKWVGTLNHQLENIGDFFLGNMVTHHHPSSWLVKEEEEESSEPKTWASQARSGCLEDPKVSREGTAMVYWRAFRDSVHIYIYTYINYICYYVL